MTNATFQCAFGFYEVQDAYARANIANPTENYEFWSHLGLIVAQFDGLLSGYNQAAAPNQTLSAFYLYFLNGAGDYEDIPLGQCTWLRPNFDNMSLSEL